MADDQNKQDPQDVPKQSQNVFRCNRRRLHISAILASLLLLGAAVYHTVYCSEQIVKVVHSDNMYGVLLDGGSVHTTVSVYTWPSTNLGNSEVKEIYNCDLSSPKGISSFVKNPEDVKNYLLDYKMNGTSCLEQAVHTINSHNRGKNPISNHTSVLLGATGGLRALSDTYPKIARQILCNASDLLSEVVLKKNITTCSLAKVISGKEEGKLGWVTVNYLLGNLQGNAEAPLNKTGLETKRKIGALDWGGASSQITFPVDDEADNGPNIESVRLYNQTTKIFTMSNICYGQSEALKRYFVQLIHEEFLKTGEIKTIIESPCQPDSKSQMYSMRGYKLFGRCTQLVDDEFETKVRSMNKSVLFKFIAKNDIEQCKKLIDRQFNYDLCKTTYKDPNTCLNAKAIPKPKPHTRFLAFSTYWYLVQKLDEKISAEKKRVGDRVRYGNFRNAAEALCTEKTENHSLLKYGHDHVQNSCFRALYMEALLSEGYHFDQWKDIRFVSTVKGESVGWTLGYILEESMKSPMSSGNVTYHENNTQPNYCIPWYIFLIWFIAATSLGAAIGTYCPFQTGNGNGNNYQNHIDDSQ